MIIEPDFPDHWKVQHLAHRLQSEAAVRCLLRLWAYCQQRRQTLFSFEPIVLAAICRWDGDEAPFWEAMTDTRTGWLVKKEDGWEVRQWADVNASLVQKWHANKGGKSAARPPADPPPTHRDSGKPPARPPADPSPTPRDSGKPPARPLTDHPIEKIEKIDQIEGAHTRTPARGAPVSVEEAQAWAGIYSQGNVEGIIIEPGWVAAWFDHRSSGGWVVVRNGVDLPIADWNADLRSWCRSEMRTGLGRKKETAAAAARDAILPADFPWAKLLVAEKGFAPTLPWEQQSARDRRRLREMWAALSDARRAEIAAMEPDAAEVIA